MRWDWVGELSHARRALEGEAVASGSEKTWKALTNEAKRPGTAREVSNSAVLVDLDVDLLLKNLRTSRRGAAAGPPGVATEHQKILLDSTECCTLFGEVAIFFCWVTNVRVRRMTVLQRSRTEKSESLSGM